MRGDKEVCSLPDSFLDQFIESGYFVIKPNHFYIF